MKTKFLGAALLASAAAMSTMCQEAVAASYTHNGVDYTWTCYGDTCETGTGSAYIDQYRIYVTPTILGVNYFATQETDLYGTQLKAIGLFTDTLLSPYLAEGLGSPILTHSLVGVDFEYHPGGLPELPDPNGAIFGAADKDGAAANGLSDAGEWLNIHYNYVIGKTVDDFLTEAMFDPDHFIYVHLQDTGASGEDSEKWKLTWTETCTGGDCGDIPPPPVPEPGMLALIGIGMLSMFAAYSRRVKI